MRRLTTPVLVLAATMVAAPAGALPALDAGHAASARGGNHCRTGVIGFDAEHRIRFDSVTDDRVVRSDLTSNTLPFDVTAWGYFGNKSHGKHGVTQLNAITTDGVPRNVTLDAKNHHLKATHVHKYDERSFSPRLYADNATYYAYTVNGGAMKRWTLTRFSAGEIRYAQPAKVGGGFGDLTSLQATAVAKVKGSDSEVLYGTTSSGGLVQVVVPFAHPGNAKVHKLASSGYEGVTELSWTVCNPKAKGDLHSLVAIDPVGNTATWTTIKHAYTKPKSTLRGPVIGQTDWHLSAVL